MKYIYMRRTHGQAAMQIPYVWHLRAGCQSMWIRKFFWPVVELDMELTCFKWLCRFLFVHPTVSYILQVFELGTSVEA